MKTEQTDASTCLMSACGADQPGARLVRRLAEELPWLHGLASVRMFFMSFVLLHREGLRSIEERSPIENAADPHQTSRAMMYFENVYWIGEPVSYRGTTYDPRALLRRACQDILGVEHLDPAARQDGSRRFLAAVATLILAAKSEHDAAKQTSG